MSLTKTPLMLRLIYRPFCLYFYLPKVHLDVAFGVLPCLIGVSFIVSPRVVYVLESQTSS